jgi:hypothetical protein
MQHRDGYRLTEFRGLERLAKGVGGDADFFHANEQTHSSFGGMMISGVVERKTVRAVREYPTLSR